MRLGAGVHADAIMDRIVQRENAELRRANEILKPELDLLLSHQVSKGLTRAFRTSPQFALQITAPGPEQMGQDMQHACSHHWV